MHCSKTIAVLLLVAATILTTKESNSFIFNRKSYRILYKKTTVMSSNSGDNKNSLVSSCDTKEPAFPNCLPKERLGTSHGSLEAFHQAVGSATRPAKKTKEYTLVVVTETVTVQETQHKHQRILLGMKNRGFGTGKFNSFGGKFLHDETGDNERESVEECACRELEEETNLRIPIKEMIESRVGVQRFTFEDNDKEMLVHLYFLDLANSFGGEGSAASYEVRACDEITPQWFESFDQVPFDNMFADDSLWLTALLSAARSRASNPSSAKPSRLEPPLQINGSYHFKENCEETNTILHYHMDIQSPKRN
ncbi:unnamed protein product [Pseudo-nitzschia multistriata]|uniref:Nudix hydrolase domain-containing protein n=1 Tax=Pseudo-nitzschia multistriata TaxID=183589 RepID=A0A448YY58_9STRA|nr:unnamed protein product [Pseudo-nitzschia multistriata]